MIQIAMIAKLRPASKMKLAAVLNSLVAALLCLTSCTISSQKLEFQRGQKSVQAKDFKSALEHFRAVIDHDPRSEAAILADKESARITHYETKSFKDAVFFYKQIVLNSPSPTDRLEAQKKIADLYFTQILDYSQTITEYSRLIELPHTQQDDLLYRTAIAKSYYYQNNFFQSQSEIDTIMKKKFAKDQLFDPLLLKANILLTTKQLDEAIIVLNKLILDYPVKAKTEAIGLVLALCYEEQKNYSKAIETLQGLNASYPRKTFIENRIQTLRERQGYLPGARGLKK